MQLDDRNAKPHVEKVRAEPASSQTAMPGASLTVGILALLYAISLIDRSILALLAQPVSKALDLDDRQMALLLGVGFALFYATGGLILGHLIDTRNRRIVVTAGVVLWSLSTVLSGFASSFWMLLILRSGVALGEAVLTPAAISLIADLYPRHMRGLPVAMFTSVAAFMTIGSYAVGAFALDMAVLTSGHFGWEPWQLTFVYVGLPGLVLAFLFAVLGRVPPRSVAAQASIDEVSTRVVISYLWSRVGFFLPLLALTGLSSLCGLAIIAWLPALLTRELGISPSRIGYLMAGVGVPAGLIGNFFWQWLATRLQLANAPSGIVRVFWVPGLLTAPLYVVGLMIDSLYLQLGFVALGMFMSTCFSVATPMTIQLFGPPRMRARITSIYLLFIAVLGYGLAPLAAVELGALIAGEGQGLRQGLIFLTLLVWPVLLGASALVIRKAHHAELQ